jgi:hypothetical protein
MKKAIFMFFLLSLMGFGVAPEVWSELVGWNYPGGLIRLDTTTGTYSNILNSDLQIEALAYDSYTGRLYGVINEKNSVLVNIEMGRGVISTIGIISGFDEITAMTFDETTRTIFALDQRTRTLLSIDAITASPAVIGNYSYGSSNALAANPVTGELYMSLMGLFGSIDKTTGKFTLIGNTGLGGITGLDFLPNTQLLYGVGQTMNVGHGYQLFTLDLKTGNPSFIGNPNLPQVTSIEFVPIPPSLLLFGSGLLGLIRFRKKFRK